MTKFKVGDAVVLARPRMAANKGRTGVVTRVTEGSLRFDPTDGRPPMCGNIDSDKFDLLPTVIALCSPALPLDSGERKKFPMFSGLLAYFPAALAQVSNHSFEGNQKHNPGLPLQHARGISGDHEDCVIRHLVDAKEHAPGSTKRIEELRALAWRSLALLQEECELAGCVPAPAASFDRVPK